MVYASKIGFFKREKANYFILFMTQKTNKKGPNQTIFLAKT